MERIASERLYSEIDLDKAYINGLECAIVVLEKVIGLNYDGQRVMIKSLKKIIRKHKINTILTNF
jgi:hypothetical protein